MTISLRLTELDGELWKTYAQINGVTLSDLIRELVMQSIQADYIKIKYGNAIATEEFK